MDGTTAGDIFKYRALPGKEKWMDGPIHQTEYTVSFLRIFNLIIKRFHSFFTIYINPYD
jgi:hypothetical protein